jgi:hypothetical protein
VLAGPFGGPGEAQDLGLVEVGEQVDGGQVRGTAGEGAGLVEGDEVHLPELFHDDCALDEYAVPSGVGDR